jgi:hypothetical protein
MENEIKTEVKQEEPKDNFFKRIGRGFKVLLGKIQGVANNMEQANKQQEKKDTLTGTDMSYAPKEFGL